MKEITNKKVYKCEYCNKLSLSKGAMAVHERFCKKNPSNWTPCASCEYLKRVRIEITNTEGNKCRRCQYHNWECGCTRYDDDKYDGECDGSEYRTEFICEITGKKMYYPRKVFLMSKEKRENIISRCDCAMPNECDNFKEM